MFKNNNNKKEELSLLTDQIKVKILQAKYETFFHGVLERIMSIQEGDSCGRDFMYWTKLLSN